MKGNQYYILNEGDDMKSNGITLGNTHAFFSDKKSNRYAKSDMVSLKNGRTENKELMYKLNQLLGNPIKPTPAPRRCSRPTPSPRRHRS